MSFKTKFALAIGLAAIFLCAACGPTYVVQPNGQQAAYQQQYQQYDPGYDPNQFLYDAMLANAVVNGINGYYGPGHIFYPMVNVGGVGGYYDSGHHFHTSVTNKTVVINNYNTGREQFTKQQASKPNYTQSQQQKPQYGTQQGTIGRGASQAPAQVAKPVYASGNGGSIGRGVASAPVASKPSYGSSSGSMSRSAPSAPSRPSYSSSSGGMSRRR